MSFYNITSNFCIIRLLPIRQMCKRKKAQKKLHVEFFAQKKFLPKKFREVHSSLSNMLKSGWKESKLQEIKDIKIGFVQFLL